MAFTKSSAEKSFLIWDGDCAFCARSVQFIQRRMRTSANIVEHQKADLKVLGLTTEQCNQALQWVNSEGQISSGSRAVSKLLKTANGAWPALGVFIDLPIIRLVSSAIYKLIAKNRQHLPGGTAACALDSPD
jgi:predicted DCC family thiol-disulfide oxidoreductase YuxK